MIGIEDRAIVVDIESGESGIYNEGHYEIDAGIELPEDQLRNYGNVHCGDPSLEPSENHSGYLKRSGDVGYQILGGVPHAIDTLGQVVCVQIEYEDGSNEIYNTAGNPESRQEYQSGLQDLEQ